VAAAAREWVAGGHFRLEVMLALVASIAEMGAAALDRAGALDEPEAHLHPAAQRSLREELASLLPSRTWGGGTTSPASNSGSVTGSASTPSRLKQSAPSGNK
jgi:hypothetical protein